MFNILYEDAMNKRLLIIFSAFVLILISIGCSGSLGNSLKFKNFAAGDVYINFRGGLITVASGKTVELKELPKGLYTYSTTYEVPANSQSSSAEGAVSGEVTIKAGTKILIVYSSTYVDGKYTIFATISSSDDQSLIDVTTSP